MKRIVTGNLLICILAGLFFAVPLCLQWEQFMDDMERGHTELRDYGIGPEVLALVSAFIAAAIMNMRLLRSEHNRTFARLMIAVMTILTVFVSCGLGMFITWCYLKSYTQALH